MGEYFNFRIVDNGDGTDIIDKTRITPMDALTPEQQIEYQQTAEDLYADEIVKRKQQREADRQRKFTYRFFHKVACMCGIVL